MKMKLKAKQTYILCTYCMYIFNMYALAVIILIIVANC